MENKNKGMLDGFIPREKVQGKDMLSLREFIDKYHEGLTNAALDYAMKRGDINYTRIGRDRVIVLTDRTLSYNPNSHPARDCK